MNKGLEVIEAHELFGVPYDDIDVVVHPQSVVHSMVEFVDGAVVAQLSMPDMRLPIGYALAYPGRLGTAVRGHRLGRRCRSSSSSRPDRATFPCLDLAYRAGRTGDLAPAWLNAANEVAVRGLPRRPHHLVGHRRGGGGHPRPLRAAAGAPGDRTVDDVLDADATARRVAGSMVAAAGDGAVSAVDLQPSVSPIPDPSRPDAAARRDEVATAARPPSSVVALVAIVALAVVTGYVDLLIVVASIIVIVMLHELGHFADGQARRHEGHRVLRRIRTPAVVLPAGRDRVRHQGPPPGRLREDPRDDQPRGGGPGRRGTPLPGQALPRPAAGGRGRFGHALPAGLRAAVDPAGLRRATQLAPGRRSRGSIAVGGLASPARVGGIRPGDIVVSVDGKPIGGNDPRADQRHPATIPTDR